MTEGIAPSNRKELHMAFDGELVKKPTPPSMAEYAKLFGLGEFPLTMPKFKPVFPPDIAGYNAALQSMKNQVTYAAYPAKYKSPKTEPSGAVAGCPCASCVTLRGAFPKAAPTPSNKERDLRELKAARARIERGWCQGATSSGRNVCAMGALVSAVTGEEVPILMDYTVEARVDYLAGLLPGVTGTAQVIQFNDRATTIKQDVLDLFDQGIAQLEGREWVREVPTYNAARWTGINL